MAELARIRSEAGELLPMLKEQMLIDNAIPDDRAADVLHVTDLVHPDTCYRAVTARMLGLELPGEPFSFQRENVFAEGNAIHRKWQHRMRRTGRLYGQWKCMICGKTETGLEPSASSPACASPGVNHIWKYDEIPFYWAPLLLAGHADGGIGTAIIELKSVGAGTLRWEAPRILADNTITRNGRGILDMDGIWNSIRRPFPSHVRQGNLYCWLARQLGLPFDHVVFIYEFKPNQQVREFVIRPSRDITRPMIEQAQEISGAVRARRLLSCPSGGCRKCEGINADSIEETEPAGRAGEQESRGHAGRAGHPRPRRRVVTPAAGRPAADAAEPAVTDRRGTDGPVPAGEPVAQVPSAPARHGRSRRVIRREPGTHSGSYSTGQSRGTDSSGDESTRPRRHVMHRGERPVR